MANHIDFDFEPYDGNSKDFDDYVERLHGHLASIVDDSGSSCSEALSNTDMGGAFAIPPNPLPVIVALAAGAGAAMGTANSDATKMTRLRHARNKKVYAVIYKNLTNKNIQSVLHTQYRHDGRAAFAYIRTMCEKPITKMELKKLDNDWRELSIPGDIGVSEDSITEFVQLLEKHNGRRPINFRYNESERCEKLLEAIFTCSKHFSELAQDEYNRAEGTRRFEHPAPIAPPAPPAPLPPGTMPLPPPIRHRDLAALMVHYNDAWGEAVRGRILSKSAPTKKTGGQPARHVVDAGLSAIDGAFSAHETALSADHPSLARRNIDPAKTLPSLLEAGYLCRRDCCTTTDFEENPGNDLCKAAEEGFSVESQFDLECAFDADDAQSVSKFCHGVGLGVAVGRAVVEFRRNQRFINT